MAAGLGFKTFTTGEVLTAADVNGYLMQGVLVFATEAARNSAITSPQEGQFAFTKDTNSLWYYSGSAWVASGATGDIEGVTAGTGISGGGTSGTVTITNSMATEITAKADLIVGTGNATFDNLPVGTNGHVLTADSTVSPTGLKWAAPAAGGKVLQVLQTLKLDTFTSNSTTAVDITGLSVTITPAAATSKILVLVTITGNGKNASNGSMFRLLRDSTDIVVPTSPGSRSSGFGAIYINDEAMQGATSVSCLDSPNTTAATTYKVQGFCVAVGNGFFVNRSPADTNNNGFVRSASSITVLEIGA
jgi:hypothetical protein